MTATDPSCRRGPEPSCNARIYGAITEVGRRSVLARNQYWLLLDLASSTREECTTEVHLRNLGRGASHVRAMQLKVSVDQDLTVIVIEALNDDVVKRWLVSIVFSRGR